MHQRRANTTHPPLALSCVCPLHSLCSLQSVCTRCPLHRSGSLSSHDKVRSMHRGVFSTPRPLLNLMRLAIAPVCCTSIYWRENMGLTDTCAQLNSVNTIRVLQSMSPSPSASVEHSTKHSRSPQASQQPRRKSSRTTPQPEVPRCK